MFCSKNYLKLAPIFTIGVLKFARVIFAARRKSREGADDTGHMSEPLWHTSPGALDIFYPSSFSVR